MRAREGDHMGFSYAYDECKRIFLSQGYQGIGSILQSEEAWVFCPDGGETIMYGALPILWPRDGSNPVYFEYTPENMEKYMNHAVLIS